MSATDLPWLTCPATSAHDCRMQSDTPEQTWENVAADTDQGFEVQRCRQTGELRHRVIDPWGGAGTWEPGPPPTRPPPKLLPRRRRRL
jgi:hypothetical protein